MFLLGHFFWFSSEVNNFFFTLGEIYAAPCLSLGGFFSPKSIVKWVYEPQGMGR
jgi:hypothetical protein